MNLLQASPKVIRQETVQYRIDDRGEEGDLEGPDEVMRSEEEVSVRVLATSVHVDETHDESDRGPHGQDQEDVEDQEADDPDVTAQALLLVRGGEFRHGREPAGPQGADLLEDAVVVVDEGGHGEDSR